MELLRASFLDYVVIVANSNFQVLIMSYKVNKMYSIK